MTILKKTLLSLVISIGTSTAFADELVMSVEKTNTIKCSDYYKTKDDFYTGQVIEHGAYIVTKDPKTLKLSKEFKVNSVTINCEEKVVIEQEKRDIACPDGMTGQINQYRYVIVKKNTPANTKELNYPDGDNWSISGGNCILASNSPNIKQSEEKEEDVKDIELKMSKDLIMSSKLKESTDFRSFVEGLQNYVKNNNQLNLVIDNLNTDKYNASNVTKAIKLFDSASGKENNFKIVSIPQTLIKYVGNGGLSKENLGNKILLNTKLTRTGKVEVTYQTIYPNKSPEVNTFSVSLFTMPIMIENGSKDGKPNGYIYEN